MLFFKTLVIIIAEIIIGLGLISAILLILCVISLTKISRREDNEEIRLSKKQIFR